METVNTDINEIAKKREIKFFLPAVFVGILAMLPFYVWGIPIGADFANHYHFAFLFYEKIAPATEKAEDGTLLIAIPSEAVEVEVVIVETLIVKIALIISAIGWLFAVGLLAIGTKRIVRRVF